MHLLACQFGEWRIYPPSLGCERGSDECVSQIRGDHALFDEMEKLTMPRHRIPKAIHSRTLAQSVFVNLVAQLILSFSQPMLAQSQQRPVASAEQASQALYEVRQR